jgi:hypothetical protein
MIQLSATRCSYLAILCVSLVSFAAIILCVASERVFIVVVVYFVIDSVRKLLDIPSYTLQVCCTSCQPHLPFSSILKILGAEIMYGSRKIILDIKCQNPYTPLHHTINI